MWKPVIGYEGLYEVSDSGVVVSCHRLYKNGKTRAGQVKVPRSNNGYHRVTLCKGSKQRGYRVHRVVLEAFIGPCPDGMQACHNNGNRTDNRVENLRWDTQAANLADRERHGLVQRGSDHFHAIFVESDIVDIFKFRGAGCTLEWIAAKYQCHETTIGNILKRKVWRHVFIESPVNKKVCPKLVATDAERIRDLRRCGATQQAIANWIGISRPMVAAIDRGERWVGART